MKTVADRLHRARERAGRSIRSLQRELHDAGVSGSSYANIHAYFSGKTQPSIEFLSAAASSLGVRAEWLTFGKGEMTQEEQAAAELVEPEREALRRDARTGIDPALLAALTNEIPRLESGLVRTYHRIVGLLTEVPLLAGAADGLRDIAFGEFDSEAERARALEEHYKLSGARDLARAIKGPAEVLQMVKLEELTDEDFALYVDAMAMAISVLAAGSSRTNQHRRTPHG